MNLAGFAVFLPSRRLYPWKDLQYIEKGFAYLMKFQPQFPPSLLLFQIKTTVTRTSKTRIYHHFFPLSSEDETAVLVLKSVLSMQRDGLTSSNQRSTNPNLRPSRPQSSSSLAQKLSFGQLSKILSLDKPPETEEEQGSQGEVKMETEWTSLTHDIVKELVE